MPFGEAFNNIILRGQRDMFSRLRSGANLSARTILVPIFSTRRMASAKTLIPIAGSAVDANGHWALVVLDLYNNSATLIDTLPGMINTNIVKELSEKLVTHIQELNGRRPQKITFTRPDSVQRQTENDCGVFTLFFSVLFHKELGFYYDSIRLTEEQLRNLRFSHLQTFYEREYRENITFDFDQVGDPADLSFNARDETEVSSGKRESPKESGSKKPSPLDTEWSTSGPPTSTPMRRRTRPTLTRRAKKTNLDFSYISENL